MFNVDLLLAVFSDVWFCFKVLFCKSWYTSAWGSLFFEKDTFKFVFQQNIAAANTPQKAPHC